MVGNTCLKSTVQNCASGQSQDCPSVRALVYFGPLLVVRPGK